MLKRVVGLLIKLYRCDTVSSGYIGSDSNNVPVSSGVSSPSSGNFIKFLIYYIFIFIFMNKIFAYLSIYIFLVFWVCIFTVRFAYKRCIFQVLWWFLLFHGLFFYSILVLDIWLKHSMFSWNSSLYLFSLFFLPSFIFLIRHWTIKCN